MRLETKKAIVTGAGGGIGRAVSEALAQQGAAVLCADINEERVNATVVAITNAGGRGESCCGRYLAGGISQGFSFQRCSPSGWLTSVVCSQHPQMPYLPVTELPLEEWQGSIDVNLTGIFLLLKNAIPAMAVGGGGSITLMASHWHLRQKPGRAWYVTQKGALSV